MKDVQEEQKPNAPVSSNPVLDSMIKKQTEAQSAPAVQEQHQAPPTEESDNPPQAEVDNKNNEEDNFQGQNEQSENQGATELENTEGDNSSQSQGGDNAEGQATPESGSDDDWYKEESKGIFDSEADTSKLPDGDYSIIGKALGLESTKAADVLTKITEMTSHNQELTEKVQQMEENSNYANPDMQSANEIARNGGDWAGYLGISQNNWDEVPDDVLIVEARLKGAFGDDVEGMNKYLNEMDPVQKRLQAADVRQGLKDNDNFGKQEIVRKANEQRLAIDNGVRKSLDGMTELYGLKMTPAMKREVYDDITGKNFLNSVFHDKDGNPSPEKMVKAAVAFKNLNKIVSTAVTKARNQGTEDVLDEVTNPKVTRQGEKVNLKVAEKPSEMDQHMKHLRDGTR